MTYKLTNTSQPADPYYGAVSLLLHGDGADGSTQIIDSSVNPKTVTAVGDAQISTTESKWNGSSLKFDGTGDYLTALQDSSYSFGTGDFTLEAWLYITAYGGGFQDFGGCLIDTRGVNTLNWPNGVLLCLTTNGSLRVFTDVTVSTSTSQIPLNTWTHVSLVRSGGSVTFYIGGQSAGTFTFTNNLSQQDMTIGTAIDLRAQTTTLKYTGYIDDLRITKGVARYTSNFTPPTQPFISTSNIVIDGLVLNLDAAAYGGSGTTWSDSSGNGNNGTLVNGVGYNSGNGGSLTFDGVDDYVTLSSSQIAPGTGAFTWNFWAKHIPTGSGVGRYSILFSGTGSNTFYGVIYMNSDTGLGYYAKAHRILDSNPAFNDEWWHIAFVGNGGPNGARTLKLYRNGVQAGGTYTYDYSFTSTTPFIGANHSSFAELMRGNISNVLYYNRELTESEIQQNYNALKGRFGL